MLVPEVQGVDVDDIDEMVEEFEESKILFGFCKVIEPVSQLNKFVLISWVKGLT